MSGAALNAMVAPWFERDRPKAISTAFNGASVGGLIFAPLWTALIAGVGPVLAARVVAQRDGRIVCPLAWLFCGMDLPAAAPAAGANVAPRFLAAGLRDDFRRLCPGLVRPDRPCSRT